MRSNPGPRNLKHKTVFTLVLSSSLVASATAMAVSPEAIAIGRQLFEKSWSPQSPALHGNDGLGPLFNANSCVACHHQGGIGGAGEAEFNAKTISIESMEVSGGPMSVDVVRQAVAGFHPGFIDPKAGVINSLPLAHHGGTTLFAESRNRLLEKIPAVFSGNGGSVSAAEVRHANATPILYSANFGVYQTSLRAKLFQRNTTPLFGAGLIDQVTSKQLRAIEREQKSHPEISGRISTIADGRMGRFGWRGNIPTLLDFCDKACAAEVGLETNRINQPVDPTVPAYRNPSVDISDTQIRAMAAFVAALPAPVRRMPEDSEKRRQAMRGEQIFASIGCAVCHRPNLGPANGIYSDLLLHDMGPESYDLNPADPYIVRITPVSKFVKEKTTETTTQTVMGDETVMGSHYYGGSYVMEAGSESTMVSKQYETSQNPNNANQSVPVPYPSVFWQPHSYHFQASPVPPTTMRIIDRDQISKTWEERDDVVHETVVNQVGRREKTLSGNDTYSFDKTSQSVHNHRLTQFLYKRAHLEPTYFTQEWKTPPLWGVNDSAPYMHDGRAETLLEAVTMHGGESEQTRDRFLNLSLEDRNAVLEFMHTLVAPPNVPQQQTGI
ncbi:hypothetical protein NHH03_09355 [Stieleria sp. TO1_6]|uniref:di-heme oxidoredictase family protein n=1 Tax=Stieleria tagensis TaxID=2956795 RepID=UPI00209A9D41|nr:di-heme oxidoredictase family protein [Stieleria tagensis]MCO8121941.1 hypothetical protein [Stieleria tagensis]